jgi:hypothetical protein
VTTLACADYCGRLLPISVMLSSRVSLCHRTTWHGWRHQNSSMQWQPTRALALRLGDRQFASEVYTDLRDQAIRAPERWLDVQAEVRLSNAVERNAVGVHLFNVLAEWEYTTVPTHAVQRFACVSDPS